MTTAINILAAYGVFCLVASVAFVAWAYIETRRG